MDEKDFITLIELFKQQSRKIKIVSINLSLLNQNQWNKVVQNLVDNKVLEEFILLDNQISPQGVQILLEGLRRMSRIKKLNISKNNLNDNGAKVIAEILDQLTHLTELYLSENRIDDNGAISFAQALSSNTNLKKLSFGDNSIGASGLKALSQSLKTNTTLTTLYLYQNKINDFGLEPVIADLKENISLCYFILRGNRISEELNLKLSIFFERNRELKRTLEINEDQIKDIENLLIKKRKDSLSQYFSSVLVTIINDYILIGYTTEQKKLIERFSLICTEGGADEKRLLSSMIGKDFFEKYQDNLSKMMTSLVMRKEVRSDRAVSLSPQKLQRSIPSFILSSKKEEMLHFANGLRPR